MELPLPPAFDHEEEDDAGNPRRFIPLRHIYSSTAPCIGATGSSNVMSKKVKASKVVEGEVEVDGADKGIGGIFAEDSMCKVAVKKGLLVYNRQRKKRGRDHLSEVSFFTRVSQAVEPGLGNGAVLREVKVEALEDDKWDSRADFLRSGKKRKLMKYELLGLGEGSGFSAALGATRLRGSTGLANGPSSAGKNKGTTNIDVAKVDSPGLGKTKRWAELSLEGADPLAFVGLPCKIFWPMDDDWYSGSISKYILETCQHQIEYKDGDVESLTLSNERIKFHVSPEDMHRLNLKYSCPNMEKKASSYDEMLALAASYDDCDDPEVGDIVWAKISGYAMWPALIINESNVNALGNRKPYHREGTVSVQFFGTHDFARINIKQVKPFLRGMLSSFHLKCKQTSFQQSLEEAKMYLSKQQLPDRMLRLQKGSPDEDTMNTMKLGETSTFGDEPCCDKETANNMACNNACPIEIGNLLVTSLGQVVCDSDHFHNKNFIWPEGYTAFRKFLSMTNPKASSKYKMEVLRHPKSKARPLFRITSDEGEQIEGPNPTFCWKEIYQRIRRNSNDSHGVLEEKLQKTGSYMFGFSHPKISQLIQDLPNNGPSSRSPDNYYDRSSGYRAVRVEWKDIDRCNVCHMDEEYEDNLFLQCDKCRMMVHARCYGELEPSDGVLWFCNLCRPDAPKPPPQCCLCPVIGGAIKPTTDGRWAHLTCAMWIPETCLSDIKKMEPINGLNRINKDRWKLLCSICGVSYGACIQCSNNNCYVAYHPLCARAAGLCVELEDEDRLYLMSYDEDDDQCIRLLSFCKKHRQPSNEQPPSEEQPKKPTPHCTSYIPPPNPSGCARSEPYNFFGRRGQKEPQVLAAASMKRLFVENKPYIVGGYHSKDIGGHSCNKYAGFLSFPGVSNLKTENDTLGGISSMGEKYKYMKATYGKRLAFGKSRIHGFGVFAKIEHKAGDMVIEYIGELVRPPIADIREHRIYNLLVGAGTYMFRIDNERVVDATRAGSIAHLINHSCEPNCYSRMISVDGDDHIIIFAKRDIHQWEELSYDYRFFSKDEQLSCYCGFSRCRGVVNDVEAEEQITKLWVPRSELIPWQGD